MGCLAATSPTPTISTHRTPQHNYGAVMIRPYVIGFSIIWICIVAMCWTPNALADSQICSSEDAQVAESVAATARSWGQLHQQFELYAHCDDGAIAEGFSESVSILLARHWKDIRQLKVMVRSDPAFRIFVIRHIDETVPVERLKMIAKNADRRCPRSLNTLCRDIKMATKNQ